MFLQEAKSTYSRQVIERKINEVTQNISMLSSVKNKKIIDEQLSTINNINGSFSRLGMWKMKSKLFPKVYDHPTAKKDGSGNLIAAAEPLKKLYLATYIHRLRPRPIREDLQELFHLKHDLCKWKDQV